MKEFLKTMNITELIKLVEKTDWNKYQKEDIELIEMCITNLIYLYSKDLKTLDKISKICGNTSKEEQLITTEELQRLNKFEALIKLPRLNAIKLDLTPDNKK